MDIFAKGQGQQLKLQHYLPLFLYVLGYKLFCFTLTSPKSPVKHFMCLYTAFPNIYLENIKQSCGSNKHTITLT